VALKARDAIAAAYRRHRAFDRYCRFRAAVMILQVGVVVVVVATMVVVVLVMIM
jgi:hypothetical protein